jgi:hypothetical protein
VFRYNSLEYAGLPGECWIPVPLPPPGTLVLAEISWLLPNGPELAGSAVRVPVSTETDDGHRAVSAELSLGPESPFPGTEIVSGGGSLRLEGYSAASPSMWR